MEHYTPTAAEAHVLLHNAATRWTNRGRAVGSWEMELPLGGLQNNAMSLTAALGLLQDFAAAFPWLSPRELDIVAGPDTQHDRWRAEQDVALNEKC